MKQDGDKNKAVEMAMSQIEKQFGKGSIMRLGSEALNVDIPFIPTGALIPGHCHRHRRYSPGPDHRNLTDPNPQEKPPWPCIPLPRPKKGAGWPLLLMPNMPWI